MNEAALIHWIQERSSKSKDVVLSIGDDAAAVLHSKRSKVLLLKADMIIEGVHFFGKPPDPFRWGQKAIRCNVSDIAAMGGHPREALLSLGLPRRIPLVFAQKILRGVIDACREYGISLVGGDTTRSKQIILSIAMTGQVPRSKMLTRKGARTGDLLFVTGVLGGSLRSGWHLSFKPRVTESQFLTRFYSVSAMMDLSDGLSKDLRTLMEASGTGARVYADAVPLRGGFQLKNALFDGEDFELLFSINESEGLRLLKDQRARQKGLCFYPIGRVLNKGSGVCLVGFDGIARPLPAPRDHHFGRGR